MTEASVPFLEVICPECEAVIPVTMDVSVGGGNVTVEANMADVWAHAFTHEGST